MFRKMLAFGGVAVLAAATAMPAAFAEEGSKWMLSGQGRVRGETYNNKDFNKGVSDNTGMIGSRFRMNVKFTPNSKVSAFFQPQFTKTWGSPAGTSGALTDTQMDVHQAYISAKVGSSGSLNMGREELIYGDHLVIGNVGWSNVARSFDVVKWRTDLGSGSWSDLFVARLSDTHHFSGLYNSFSTGFVDALDVYVLYSVNRPATGRLATFGARAKSAMGSLDFRVEVTGQAYTPGYQADAEVGYTVDSSRKLRVSAEYFRSTENYIQLYPTAHKWLGIADLFSRRNISGFRFGAGSSLFGDFSAKADFHLFSRTVNTAPAYTFGGTSWGTAGTASGIGNEVDVVLNYAMDPAMKVQLGGSLLMAGQYLKDNAGSDSGYFAFLQFTANL